MISLDIKNDQTSPRVAVVGCLHGNELIGRSVFLAIAQRPEEFKNIIVIIANTDAYAANRRLIDQDLNRSFPGDSQGNVEQRLAAELLPLVVDADYVIDLHTTTSPSFGTAAIVGPLVDRNKRIIQAFKVDRVAIMERSLLDSSLIGNVQDGVSLEYGLEVVGDSTKLVEHILESIRRLQFERKMTPITATTYDVIRTIPLDSATKDALKNFEYSQELGGYPFIVDEKHYTTMRGFLLGNKRPTLLDI